MKFFLTLLFFGVMTSTPCLSSPFDDYTKIQKAITSYSVNESTLNLAHSLFPGRNEFFKDLKPLTEVDAKGSRALMMSGKYSNAYFEFIRMPANADVLTSFMLDELGYMKPSLDNHKEYQGAVLSWGWSNIARASIIAYQKTGERRFIHIYTDTIPWVFDNLDSSKPDDHSGKIGDDGWSLVDGGVVKRDVTTVGRITAPIIQMALVTKGDNRLSLQERERLSEYARKAIDILRPYLKHQIIEGKIRYYRFPWTGENEAMNHMAAFAEACAFAYKMTGEAEFKAFVEGYFEYFRSKVTIGDDGTYSWPYQVLAKGQHEEFFWKGAITVPALINIHASGIHLEDRDIRGICNSFDNYVIGQFYGINAYMGYQKFYLTGYNSYRLGYTNGLLFPQFVFLEEWRPGTKEKVINAIASRTDLFPVGLLIHASDAVAYAYMLPSKR